MRIVIRCMSLTPSPALGLPEVERTEANVKQGQERARNRVVTFDGQCRTDEVLDALLENGFSLTNAFVEVQHGQNRISRLPTRRKTSTFVFDQGPLDPSLQQLHDQDPEFASRYQQIQAWARVVLAHAWRRGQLCIGQTSIMNLVGVEKLHPEWRPLRLDGLWAALVV